MQKLGREEMAQVSFDKSVSGTRGNLDATASDIIEIMKDIDQRMANLGDSPDMYIVVHPLLSPLWYEAVFHNLPPLIKAKIRLAMTCALLGTRKWIDYWWG